ncbi:MAG: aspartate aminotransferase family protein [Alphaproteobacteria bacterium]|jgi:4-aminobutyrate--pyruvate transaminase|nr:aspartate aminotransferase family protein [Alphaproteobacteria bacterium]
MNIMPNSPQARDIAYHVHPQTNLKLHQSEGPLVIDKGEGVYVWDDAGNRYIEAMAGLWCASLGFSERRLAEVAYEQMKKLPYGHTFFSRGHEPSIDLAERLLAMAPVPMSKVLFQCSGSEANDTAIKLVWYYNNAIGRPEKKKIIGRIRGYHGTTAAAVSLSGQPHMHADFDLPFPQFKHTDNPHYYRFHEDGESEEDFATRMAANLEQLIQDEGPETVAAFFAEPVQGGGGAIVPPATYFDKIQAVLKKYDVLFIADEVICGFGRTGNMWGSQTYDLQPDMLTCAKALSASYMPISAVMVSEPIYQAMVTESEKVGVFGHGYTYSAHPVASAVALETLKIYEEIDLVGMVQARMPHFQASFAKLAEHPLVGDVRGVGLLVGMELVRDKATREAFDPDEKVGLRAEQHCLRHGIITRAIGDRLAICPPLIIEEEQIDEIALALTKAIDDTAAELG